jgi:ABC-2 type transport system ATP-binding protein
MSVKVVVDGLRKRYGLVEAVRGLSFTIHDGEVFGLIGPNGAGKTTTIECVLGLTEPDDGRIEVCGIDARRHPRDVKQVIGAALQTTSLQDRITPREALRLFGSFYKRRIAPETLLERFSLVSQADVAVDTLSGGQRQRLALALAFVNDPALVFLDEPTSGLDAQARRDLHEEILRMRRDGHTVLLTTHYLDEAELLCDRIAIVARGRIVAAGTPAELVAQSTRRQTIRVRTTTPLASEVLASIPGVDHIETGGVEIVLQTSTPSATVAALTAMIEQHGSGLEELHMQKATLEDVFVDLTRTGAN